MKLSFISEHQKQTANPDMLEQGEEKGNEWCDAYNRFVCLIMVTADASLCVQCCHTFLKQRHGSSWLFLLAVLVLYIYKVLQQLSKID